MRTKKFFLVALLVTIGLVSVNSAKAQNKKSDEVTVKINLHEIQSLVVNPAQKTVTLDYKTPDDYKDGVSSKEQKDHLSVFSTGGFDISVKSNGNFNNSATNKKINASDVKIIAEAGSGNKASDRYQRNITLGTSAKTLISSTTGARDRKYTITYDNKAGKDDNYLSFYNTKGGKPNVFTAQVTYTIAPK
ncbi:MAG TPA: hypothetical protein DEF88_11065 [Porphyromonadaceae bacterium]|jgi:hypothetical protein|nr:hypothetical protein [Porphyromonadaceae bacterium]HBX20976.1 hypothetical protein [Porphyromonadaceae bacterium]HCM20019.1 hypothetical protein [Porphyromonadaceae bacterium]